MIIGLLHVIAFDDAFARGSTYPTRGFSLLSPENYNLNAPEWCWVPTARIFGYLELSIASGRRCRGDSPAQLRYVGLLGVPLNRVMEDIWGVHKDIEGLRSRF